MTTPQRIKLMVELWPNACAAQGWDASDRDFRLLILSQAVGRALTSASQLDHLRDFDDVKARLLALSQPANLGAQVAIANMPRTRAIYAVRAQGFNDAYIKTLCGGDDGAHGRFGTWDWETLPIEALEQLRNTLADRRVEEHKPSTLARRRSSSSPNSPSSSSPSKSISKPSAINISKTTLVRWNPPRSPLRIVRVPPRRTAGVPAMISKSVPASRAAKPDRPFHRPPASSPNDITKNQKWPARATNTSEPRPAHRLTMSKPQQKIYSRTMFVVEGNPTALLVTQSGRRRIGRSFTFLTAEAALAWCRRHRASLVYLPSDPSCN